MAFLNKTFLVNLIFVILFYLIVALEPVYDATYSVIGRPLKLSVQQWYPYLNTESKANPLPAVGWWVHLLVFVILLIAFDKLKPKIKFLN